MKDLLERLRDVDFRVRKEAVIELKDIPDGDSLTLLVEALSDENETVTREAIRILKDKGDSVIPQMIMALKHTSYGVRRNASKVLVGLGNSFLDMLLDLAKTNDDDIQFWICEVISQFGTKAVKTLIEVMEGGNMPRKLCAISALGKTGVKEAVKPLLNCLSDCNWTIRRSAAAALVKLGPEAVKGVAKLTQCKTPDLEFWAIQILGQIGGDSARKALIDKTLAENTTVDQKQVLISALKNFESSEVIPPLVQMLGDENWIIRKLSADALWEVGEYGQEELARSLKSKNDNIRYWTCKVLGELQAVQYTSELVKIMKHDVTWSVRASAAQALGEIGEESSTLDLVDALRDSSEYVRKNALIALNKLGEVKEVRQKVSDEWVQEFTRSIFSDLKSKKERGITTRIRALIKDVPDFPKPGVIFKDISPLLMSAHGISDVVKLFESNLRGYKIDVIAGIESRGFIFGAALAQVMRCSFIPIRKKGKLPGKCISVSYELEYGNAELEVQTGYLKGKNVVVVDDVLATGGTAAAAAKLLEEAEGRIIQMLFLIELDFLLGRQKLNNHRIESILHYS